jgi:hypothetical protein
MKKDTFSFVILNLYDSKFVLYEKDWQKVIIQYRI